MEHQLYKTIVAILDSLFKEMGKRPTTDFEFSDERIVAIYYWSVINDRPVSWAVQRRHWPIHLRKQALPANSTMSRRLRSAPVVTLLRALEQRVLPPKEPGLFWMIDGKPLVIGGCSKDKQAGYGRAAAGKARGYKLHALAGVDGIADFRVTPMNTDERTMAARMLKNPTIEGYLVGDKNYDSNPLHDICDEQPSLQLIVPRRRGPGHGLGRHRQSPSRLRSVERLENPYPQFGKQLRKDRNAIERTFANLTNWGGGLMNLPSWVRTNRRVRNWVGSKLVFSKLKRERELTTYVT